MSKVEPRRLGRGLSSLMGASDLPVEQSIPETKPGALAPDSSSANLPLSRAEQSITGSVLDLPIDSIVPNPHQPRRSMNQQALGELAASIKATGLIQPILVRRTAEGQTQLIAGERRWRASKLAGLKTIPAIVRRTDDLSSVEQALVENLHRQDLTPLEEAAAYSQLIDDFGLTHAQVSSRVGKSRSAITNTLRLLSLPPAIQPPAKNADVL